jgi:xanthine dehydrogenase accessory factor
MKEIIADVQRWRQEGQRVALARVVGVEGSGPRLPGAAMAVSEGGDVSGSVSGGCVEGAVVAEALEVLSGDGRLKLCSFGYSDDEAFAVGLTCGGTIHVTVETIDEVDHLFATWADALTSSSPVVVAEIVEGAPGELGAKLLYLPGRPAQVVGTLGEAELDRVVARDAEGQLATGLTTTRHYGPCGEAGERDLSVFIEPFAPPPRMVIIGAVDFTASLAKVAKVLGYRVTVCDARPVFATRARFPMADEVVVAWPDRYLAEVGQELGPRDAVCILTHDMKFDVPAVATALGTPVGYVGAMGSRRTTEDRAKRLRGAGVSEAALGRLMAPIGLDIGARSPEETAVAICAEIVALRAGRTAPSLRDSEGPIHVDLWAAEPDA